MSQAVEEAYQWKSNRGLEIVKTAILAIEYDEDTKKLLSDVKKADALSGSRGNSFMQQSVARGVQAAGENPNGGGTTMAFMGMNAANGMMQGVQQQNNTANPFIDVSKQQNPTDKLLEMKKLLDAGAITQEDYDKIKNQILGL